MTRKKENKENETKSVTLGTNETGLQMIKLQRYVNNSAVASHLAIKLTKQLNNQNVVNQTADIKVNWWAGQLDRNISSWKIQSRVMLVTYLKVNQFFIKFRSEAV